MRLAGVWLVAALSLAALALTPSGARAQPFQGIYIGAGAGYNIPQNIQIVTPEATPQRHYVVSNNGFASLASIGYGLGNGFRFELEGNFRQDGFSHVTGLPVATTGSGKIQTYGGMANVLFDLDIGFPWLYPYIGGGAGYEETRFNDVSATAQGSFGHGVVLQSSASAGGFAFQAIAGLSFPMPRVPGLSLTTEYRFLGIPGSESAHLTYPTGSLKLDRQFSNSFLVGVRYAFGVTPPPTPAPAAAAPAPAPARSYQVFFDWDKATLTDRARQIIKEAAEASTKVQTTRIEVNGYTDTSGTPQYNKGLSVRRAEAVAAELVRDGVARNEIAIQGFGDTHLLVATGPGVREPQNRRVEIILH